MTHVCFRHRYVPPMGAKMDGNALSWDPFGTPLCPKGGEPLSYVFTAAPLPKSGDDHKAWKDAEKANTPRQSMRRRMRRRRRR